MYSQFSFVDSVLLSILHSPDYCVFMINFEIRSVSPPPILFFSQIVFIIRGPLNFHMNFKVSLSVSAVKSERFDK